MVTQAARMGGNPALLRRATRLDGILTAFFGTDLLDRVTFRNAWRLRAQRTVLGEVADTLPQVPDALTPDLLDEAVFTRLVR